MSTSDEIEIIIDHEECIGCGACETEAPETFMMDDEAHAQVKEPPHDEKDFIVNAAEACPTEAIKVTSKATGDVLIPAE